MENARQTFKELLKAAPICIAVVAAGVAGMAIFEGRNKAADRQRATVAELHAYFERASLSKDASSEEAPRPDAVGFVRTQELKDSLNEPPPLFPGEPAAPAVLQESAAPERDVAEDAKRAEWGLPKKAQTMKKPDPRSMMAGMLGGFGGGAMQELLGATSGPATQLLGNRKSRLFTKKRGPQRRRALRTGRRLIALR